MIGIGYGHLSSILKKVFSKETKDTFTLGKVEDTNDPEQMGRVRARCAGFGDSLSTKIGSLPWILPISPLAGVSNFGTRGAEESQVNAPVAYGMWNTPKVGSYVMVGCIDGDKSKRFFVGAIHPQYVTNTLPHGRYVWREPSDDDQLPDGPLSANEVPIEPLYTNIENQFTAPDASLTRRAGGTPTTPRKDNAEYYSRGADMMVSAIDEVQTGNPESSPGNFVADHKPGDFIDFKLPDGSTRTIYGPGYSLSHTEADGKYPDTGDVNYDSHNYSWTTPGFHSIGMNDRFDQCRVRVRTTSGHQILMDDTNERIYVSTAGGNSYIEIDSVGNIDIFAEKTISTHAKGDINFYSDKSIRMQAVEGIHLRADDDIRLHSLKDVHVRAEENIRTHSKLETRIESDTDTHVRVGVGSGAGTLYVQSQDNLHMTSETGQLNLKSAERMSLKSTEWISGDAEQIHWNSAHANDAESAQESEEIQANWTTRVPDHEPWARVFMKETDSDATVTGKVNMHVPEYSYTDSLVGKGGRGDTYTRNRWWQR